LSDDFLYDHGSIVEIDFSIFVHIGDSHEGIPTILAVCDRGTYDQLEDQIQIFFINNTVPVHIAKFIFRIDRESFAITVNDFTQEIIIGPCNLMNEFF